MSAHVLVLMYGSSCKDIWFADVRNQTQNRLLQIALALRAYRVDHGAYPAKLSELVPSYLKSLPDDPFAMRGSFGYRREGDKYVLWSVGPDAKDDGGRPIVNPKAKTPSRFDSDEHSKGDIVAGTNDLR